MQGEITSVDRILFWETISNARARRVFDLARLSGADDEAKLIAVLSAFKDDAQWWQRVAIEGALFSPRPAILLQ